MKPLVTVVISAREGHWLAEQSLLSVLADDAAPFKLLYIDTLSPPGVAERIAALAAAHDFKFVRHDEWIAPAAARALAMAKIDTRYVAFVDNDVLVERGCLAKLLACAEDTGAGLVGPLYLQAGAGREPSIHMAGGVLEWTASEPRALTWEGHRLLDAPLDAAAALGREEVDFLEFHFLLARTDLVKRPGALSEDVLLVHEHIDLALAAREQGLTVWMAPEARVTYLAFAPQRLQDIAFFRRRWDIEACEASLAAFARRWPIADPEAMHAPVRHFVKDRLEGVTFSRAGPRGADLGAPMAAHELAQTRCALREHAIGRGYGAEAVRALEAACDVATLLFDGIYRPDGRPFLNHVIGTASALIRYELKVDIVAAGLLHAAYTHRADWMAEDEVSRMLGACGAVERLVRAQSTGKDHTTSGAAEPGLLTAPEASTLCIRAANEADMLLSGEYRATSRPIEFTAAGLTLLEAALGWLGVGGLAATAGQPKGDGQQGPLLGLAPVHGSFRLDARNRRIDWIRVRA
jgi:GT2 family glycosyltransferase